MNKQELQERTFENMCLFFKTDLKHIHAGDHHLATLSQANRKKMRIYGVIPNKKFGRMCLPYLTDRTIKFLGLQPHKKEAKTC